MDLALILKIASGVLILSEAMAVIQTLLFPDNKGFGGIIAAIIKILKGVGVSDQPPAA